MKRVIKTVLAFTAIAIFWAITATSACAQQGKVRPAWRRIDTGRVMVGPRMSYIDALGIVARMSQKAYVGNTWIQWRRKLWIIPLWNRKKYFTKVTFLNNGAMVPISEQIPLYHRR